MGKECISGFRMGGGSLRSTAVNDVCTVGSEIIDTLEKDEQK